METAEEFIIKWEGNDNFTHPDEQVRNEYIKRKNQLIGFAKLHVQEALKQVSEKGFATKETKNKGYRNLLDENGNIFGKPIPITSNEYILDKDSILNSYPLEDIK